ncbi:MAG TPA: hypothetical protein VGG72_06210 [Bryobacteraceae bacterium]
MRKRLTYVLCALSMPLLVRAQPMFPEFRITNAVLGGMWKQSPIVAVGEIYNITNYGVQSVESLPPPMSADVHRLYWCEADFSPVAVVKGALPKTAKKYLWASVWPECKTPYDDDPKTSYNREKTHIWFLREEGEFIRPPFDVGHREFGILPRWETLPSLPPKARLGTFLLMPSANADTHEEYDNVLGFVFDIACDLLGKEECVRHLKELGALGNPKLRDHACGLLEALFKQTCPPIEPK